MSVGIGIAVGEVEARKPFVVRCGACEHRWTAAYLPMLMDAAAKLLLGLHCPMCAQGPKKIFFAGNDARPSEHLGNSER